MEDDKNVTELEQKTDSAENAQTEQRAEEEKQETPQQPANNDDTTKKVICAISYLFGILFFLPLIVFPNDEFAKFHANQSLIVLLVSVIGGAVFGILSIIPAVGIVFSILLYIFEVLMLVLCILGIVSAARLEKKELPVIGKFRIIK